MRRATTLLLFGCLVCVSPALAQEADFILDVPLSDEFDAAYVPGSQSGARSVAGPYDLDGDNLAEVLVSDYTRGGRVHVIENTGVNSWEWVFTTPVLDTLASLQDAQNNIRVVAGGDLDADGMGEIIFFTGRSFSEFNPNIDDLPPGLYVFEYTGTANDYGTEPASIYNFGETLPDRWRMEQIVVEDIDGDGRQEIAFGNNGSDNQFDEWRILSVNGDIGSGFEVWVEEARVSSRASEDYDPVDRGGGSPYAIHAADLNGDGQTDLSLHSWNNFNFTNATVTGPDTYVFPDADDANVFIHASPTDDPSFFGGVVVDIDNDGNDEIFYPNLSTNDVSLLNYDDGETVLSITEDNFVLGLLPELSGLGITAGDLDGDGTPELIGSGPAFTATRLEAGETPVFLRVAKYVGGDIEDPSSYDVIDIPYFEPFDIDPTHFDLIQRDSAGVMTEFLRDTGATPRAGRASGRGAVFVSKLAYLGDVDEDGDFEVAAAFQGVDDSTYVIQETFNPQDSTYTQEIVEVRPVENRAFMRILSFTGTEVAVEEPSTLPGRYELSANYPNPFNPTTTFSFTLPTADAVSVKIYDVMGRLVKTLINDQQFPQGTYQLTWNGTNDAGATVASGRYIYSLEYGGTRQSRTMVLVK